MRNQYDKIIGELQQDKIQKTLLLNEKRAIASTASTADIEELALQALTDKESEIRFIELHAKKELASVQVKVIESELRTIDSEIQKAERAQCLEKEKKLRDKQIPIARRCDVLLTQLTNTISEWKSLDDARANLRDAANRGRGRYSNNKIEDCLDASPLRQWHRAMQHPTTRGATFEGFTQAQKSESTERKLKVTEARVTA